MREGAKVVERRFARIRGVDEDGAAAQGADQDGADGGVARLGDFLDGGVRGGVQV